MRHVGLALPEEHVHHVRDPVVDVVLHEGQPVPHGEELAQRDGVAGVAGIGPLGHGGGGVEVHLAVADQQADHRLQHRLGHRPAEQRRLGRHRCRRPVEVLERALVALGDEPPAVHHDDGERPGERPVVVEGLVEQRGQVDTRRECALGPALGGPAHADGLGWQRDEVAHTEARNDSRATLVSAGRSCCTQWPAPSTTVAPRKSGMASAISSIAPGIMEFTGSSEPVMKPVGMV